MNQRKEKLNGRKRRAILALLLVLIGLLLAACGGKADAKTPGDAEAGQKLFNQGNIKDAPGCITCHSIQPGKVIVGPSLARMATRAADRLPATSAGDYLRQSITDPNSFVVASFSGGIMYQQFKEVLTADQIDDLVAYLMTLE